jgi:hypothetical protein
LKATFGWLFFVQVIRLYSNHQIALEACSMETKSLTGSCLCRSVRYTVQGEPQRAFHCHCSRCRKATGTGHASNLFFAGTLVWNAGEALVR